MTGCGPTLLASGARHLSRTQEIVTFPTSGGGSWNAWDRFLAVRGERVFEIGNVCGTCEFWFRRLGAAASVDFEALDQKLANGLTTLDRATVDAFASILQAGTWRIALLHLMPILTTVGSAEDYFSHEQRAVWHIDQEPPHDPGTSYYRIEGRYGVPAPEKGDLIYEFIAPLQALDGLNPDRIAFFEERLTQGVVPTAVAASVLDIKCYYDSSSAHWGLAHYLLDGHHKVEAASRTGRPLTLLTFISSEHGISSPENVDRLLRTYRVAPGHPGT